MSTDLNVWYAGWGWFLWYGLIFVMFASIGNWGYTYRAHRRFGSSQDKDAIDMLNERYARGDIRQDEFLRMKDQILESRVSGGKTKRTSHRPYVESAIHNTSGGEMPDPKARRDKSTMDDAKVAFR